MNDGWMGSLSYVLHALGTVRADHDDEGNFIVKGTISSFMGMTGENAEVVVSPDASYRVGDHWASIAGLMNATSYGLRKVTVI